eukprot:scaffold5.g962.t1
MKRQKQQAAQQAADGPVQAALNSTRLLDLGDEVLALIFERLGIERRRATVVCKRFRDLAAASCHFYQQDGQTLQDVVELARAGDTCHLLPGFYKESLLVRKPLHLTCAAGARARLASPARFAVFANAPVLLERMVLKSHSPLEGMDLVCMGPGTNYVHLRHCQLFGCTMGIQACKGPAARLVMEHCRLGVCVSVDAGRCDMSDCRIEMVSEPVAVASTAALALRRCAFHDVELCLDVEEGATFLAAGCTFWGYDRGPVIYNCQSNDPAVLENLLAHEDPPLTEANSYIISDFNDARLPVRPLTAEEQAAVERGELLQGKAVFWNNRAHESASNLNMTAQQEEVRREARLLMVRMVAQAPPPPGMHSDLDSDLSLGNSAEASSAAGLAVPGPGSRARGTRGPHAHAAGSLSPLAHDSGLSDDWSSSSSSSDSDGDGPDPYDPYGEPDDIFDLEADFQAPWAPGGPPPVHHHGAAGEPLFWEDEHGAVHMLDTDSSTSGSDSDDSSSSSSSSESDTSDTSSDTRAELHAHKRAAFGVHSAAERRRVLRATTLQGEVLHPKFWGEQRRALQLRLAVLLESKWAHCAVVALVLLDLSIVATELSLSSFYPTACEEWRPIPHAVAGGAPDAGKKTAMLLGPTSQAILVVFCCELLLKLVVFGPRYFRLLWHALDAAVVVASLTLELVLRGVGAEVASLLIFFRLWRIVRIMHGVAEAIEMHHETEAEGAKRRTEALQRALDAARRQAAALQARLLATWLRAARSRPAAPATYHLGMAAQFFCGCGIVAFMFQRPALFLEWRTWIALAARVLLYVPSSSRQLRGAPQALGHAAAPGALGAAVDLLRLLHGEPSTRTLFIVLNGMLFPLPLPLQLAVQVVQLLQDPLMRARVADAHSLLSHAFQATPLTAPVAYLGLDMSDQQRCSSTVLFVRLALGILPPAVAAARRFPLAAARRAWRRRLRLQERVGTKPRAAVAVGTAVQQGLERGVHAALGCGMRSGGQALALALHTALLWGVAHLRSLHPAQVGAAAPPARCCAAESLTRAAAAHRPRAAPLRATRRRSAGAVPAARSRARPRCGCSGDGASQPRPYRGTYPYFFGEALWDPVRAATGRLLIDEELSALKAGRRRSSPDGQAPPQPPQPARGVAWRGAAASGAARPATSECAPRAPDAGVGAAGAASAAAHSAAARAPRAEAAAAAQAAARGAGRERTAGAPERAEEAEETWEGLVWGMIEGLPNILEAPGEVAKQVASEALDWLEAGAAEVEGAAAAGACRAPGAGERGSAAPQGGGAAAGAGAAGAAAAAAGAEGQFGGGQASGRATPVGEVEALRQEVAALRAERDTLLASTEEVRRREAALERQAAALVADAETLRARLGAAAAAAAAAALRSERAALLVANIPPQRIADMLVLAARLAERGPQMQQALRGVRDAAGGAGAQGRRKRGNPRWRQTHGGRTDVWGRPSLDWWGYPPPGEA